MFDRAQKQGYNLYSLPFQRGQAFRGARRLDEAYHQFTEAMLMTPPSPAYDILRLQLRTGPRCRPATGDTAVSDLTAYLQYDAKHDEARYLLALASPRARPAERGARVIDAGSETMKRGGPAHYARALAYHRLGRKAEAAREIDEAVRIGPANPMLLQWQARIRAMR
jgi:tetratricopeptide (TPR) repeat protein